MNCQSGEDERAASCQPYSQADKGCTDVLSWNYRSDNGKRQRNDDTNRDNSLAFLIPLVV